MRDARFKLDNRIRQYIDETRDYPLPPSRHCIRCSAAITPEARREDLSCGRLCLKCQERAFARLHAAMTAEELPGDSALSAPRPSRRRPSTVGLLILLAAFVAGVLMAALGCWLLGS